ncbi:Crp/Fnr family transcriptional regulator [Mucilaginibacter arboris]|uniref:Cyclic nucleotide-binding domain-containing protein n=1 Tax=Mucilaginibacter arboris TaxID=2682090 RepID=A0A7K1SWA3_9SPHI|nr:Crp/Fnr family transcriptional regulator [Mucilaginibacter arboris]MVN21596.1 cyclic nucleotide-binding domain-containing protein [Mucilaginibacter arboris]
MKTSKIACDLKSCFLCKLCLKEWIPAVASARKNFVVKKGDVIFNEGDPVSGVYFVYSGNVKVHKKWGEDKELIIRFVKNGSILGHRGLGGNLEYPITATALEAGIVCFFDLDFFTSTLKVNHDLTYNLLLFYADELQVSERKMRNLAHMPVKGRTGQALINLSTQFGFNADGYIDIELSRQDLASYIGATYETLFRVINELILDGTIAISGKQIKILNDQKVFQLIQDTSV